MKHSTTKTGIRSENPAPGLRPPCIHFNIGGAMRLHSIKVATALIRHISSGLQQGLEWTAVMFR
jgi:hypothetical protein